MGMPPTTHGETFIGLKPRRIIKDWRKISPLNTTRTQMPSASKISAELRPELCRYLFKALTPKLDASYSTAQRIKNVSIKTPFTASVKAYQPGKGFAIYASVNKTNFIDKYRSLGYGSGRYYLVLLNPSFKTNGFNQATDYFFNPDEQTARKLEGYLSAHRSNANDLVLMDIQVNGYVLYTESQGNDRYTVIAPDSITLLGKNREPIVTIESKYMDKTVLIQNDMDGDPTIKAIFQKIKKAFGVKDAPKTGGVYLS